MTDCHSSNVAKKRSFEIRVEDMVDDERPPRGRDRPPVVAVVNLSIQSREPVIQENLDCPVTAAHLEIFQMIFKLGWLPSFRNKSRITCYFSRSIHTQLL